MLRFCRQGFGDAISDERLLYCMQWNASPSVPEAYTPSVPEADLQGGIR